MESSRLVREDPPTAKELNVVTLSSSKVVGVDKLQQQILVSNLESILVMSSNEEVIEGKTPDEYQVPRPFQVPKDTDETK